MQLIKRLARAAWALALALAACATPGTRVDLPESGSSFLAALHSDGPAPDRANQLGLYAFLIGSWDTRILAYDEAGTKHESRGEIHADWVLEGRAIQDIWMTPPRAERKPGEPLPQLPVTGAWYGTTLRSYDPKLDAWHILWSDPATQFYARQIGRAEGNQIVQQGTLPSGAVLRWRFTEIQADSFHWLGEASTDGGKTWRLQVEVFARRAAEASLHLRNGERSPAVQHFPETRPALDVIRVKGNPCGEDRLDVGDVLRAAGDQFVDDHVLHREDGSALAVADRLLHGPADRFLLVIGSGDQEIDDPELGVPEPQQLALGACALHLPA